MKTQFRFDEFAALQSRLSKIAQATPQMTDDQREAFEERAAILEFCAGLERAEAERQALAMLPTSSPTAPQRED